MNQLRRNKKLTAALNEAIKVFKLNSERSIHGPEHWERVDGNVIELAKNTPGCDIEVARLFAILHDCKRQDEEVDKEHGDRAAEFARELYDKGLLEIDPEQFSTLNFAIKHHNDGLVSNDPTIGACWDADRLDLPRVGTVPIADMLFTQYAKERL